MPDVYTHLFVVLPAPLKQDHRSDDTDSAHEHGKHQGNCHPAQHLSIPICCNNIKVEVCPRSVIALHSGTIRLSETWLRRCSMRGGHAAVRGCSHQKYDGASLCVQSWTRQPQHGDAKQLLKSHPPGESKRKSCRHHSCPACKTAGLVRKAAAYQPYASFLFPMSFRNFTLFMRAASGNDQYKKKTPRAKAGRVWIFRSSPIETGRSIG